MDWRLGGFKVVLAAGYLLLLVASSIAAQVPSAEYRVKAAFLYNFSKFVEWPPKAFSGKDAPLVICLAGDPFGGILDEIVQGQRIDGRPVAVRRIRDEQIQGCHLVYVSSSESQRSAGINAAATHEAILTVGDAEDFIDKGGMIRFIEKGRRLHFQINPDAAERASLKISSRLLQLAEVVLPGKE